MINKLKFALSFLAMALSLSINATITSGTCGESATFRLEDDGTLYIEGSGEIRNYPNSTFLSSKQKKEVKVIKISEGITSIGYYAFQSCSSLASITISNSVTSIGECAFYKCSSLSFITIPNSVTSIGDGAFNGCSSLASITIPNSVTSIGDCAFQSCM